MSEDLDEIRALADRILVIYEGEIVGELHAGAASIEELGLAHGRRDAAREARAPSRRSRGGCPSPFRSARCVVAFAIMGVVLKLTGHSPWETYRKIVEAGFTGNGRALGDADLGDADPLHRARCGRSVSHAALQHRRRGAALPRSRRSVVDRAPARRSRCDVDAALRRRDVRRGGRARSALGADPGRPSRVREDERDHHVADAQLRGGPAAHVPDLRQLVLLARHVDAAGPSVPAGEADAGGVRTGRRSARRSSSRSGSSSGSSPRSSCGSSTRGCVSGSRSASSRTRRARRGMRACARAERSSP